MVVTERADPPPEDSDLFGRLLRLTGGLLLFAGFYLWEMLKAVVGIALFVVMYALGILALNAIVWALWPKCAVLLCC